MDRKYKRAERINVYATQADKDAGVVFRPYWGKPYSYGGYDTYKFDGQFYPGYVDPLHPDVDACITLKPR